MKKLMLVLFVLVLAIALWPAAAEAGAGYRLVAGQNQIVGWIFVDNDATNLTVTFETKFGMGFCLNETHLHVADDVAEIPQNNGNPTPGQFDFKSSHNCIQTATYVIPLASLDADGNGELVLAAHADIGNYRDPEWQETGWGVVCGDVDNPDFQFSGGNWAMFTPYPIK